MEFIILAACVYSGFLIGVRVARMVRALGFAI